MRKRAAGTTRGTKQHGVDPSRIRSADAAREALSTIAARPARSVLTLIGTVLGCAAVIAILGLTDTAKGQITATFNELAATTVTVEDVGPQGAEGQVVDDPTAGHFSFPDDTGARLRALNGVVDAGVYFSTPGADPTTGEPRTVATRPQADGVAEATGSMLSVWGVEGGTLRAAQAQLSSGVIFGEFHTSTRQPVAVLGSAAARSLGIPSVLTNPTVFFGNDAYVVVGILSAPGSLPELDNAVLIPAPLSVERYGPPAQTARALIRTELGAAQLIARQAPYALDPAHPEYLAATSPPDWSMVSDPVQTSMSGLLLGLAAIALVIGCVAIANTTLVAVMERTGEIGLRQALGAKPSHILFQFLLESVILGGLGGLLGSAFGVGAVLVGSLIQQWTPVLEPSLLLLSPALGVVTGALAGLYPSWRASRIPPAAALQRM
ncbi:MAG: ABC transporter permease [Arachnia sp.]